MLDFLIIYMTKTGWFIYKVNVYKKNCQTLFLLCTLHGNFSLLKILFLKKKKLRETVDGRERQQKLTRTYRGGRYH